MSFVWVCVFHLIIFAILYGYHFDRFDWILINEFESDFIFIFNLIALDETANIIFPLHWDTDTRNDKEQRSAKPLHQSKKYNDK